MVCFAGVGEEKTYPSYRHDALNDCKKPDCLERGNLGSSS
jgi:hypothetical protein